MRQERIGALDVRVIEPGAVRPALGVVLLHGYGAPATDLVGLARVLAAPDGTLLAFPAAPVTIPQLGADARAWWHVDVVRLQAEYLAGRGAALREEDPPELASVRDAVVATVRELAERYELPPQRVVLGGFSQGAMVACDVACRSELPLAGLVALSGMVLAEPAWRRGAARRAGLRVFQSHGTLDFVVPYVAGESLRELLVAAGLRVEWHTFPGGHGVPQPVVTALGGFLRDLAESPA